jgi:hypothetical protein
MLIHDSVRPDHIGILHAVDLSKPRWMSLGPKHDRHLSIAPNHMNVGRRMLPGREIDANLESVSSENRRHGQDNPSVGF